MEFFEAVAKRRSIRKFTAAPVPGEVIEKALHAALIAPNSSNLQPWEFYWVRSPEPKKRLVQFCFNQSAARTAAELVVAVARVDTWCRNRDLVLQDLGGENAPSMMKSYYRKLIPLLYIQEPFGIFGAIKWLGVTFMGLFRPIPRSPLFRSELFNVVAKTTALACENFMLAITAQGYATCPMEGFDEKRVKKLLGLGFNAQVVMVIAVGEQDPGGRVIPQFRVPAELVIKKI